MEIIKGDIHNIILDLPDNKYDMIYTDPPFATTENKWDTPLRWNEIFKQMWRVLKPNGVIILHSSMPFTYDLIVAERPKYHWIWIKDRSTNFFHAKKQPLRKQEEILVFYKKQPTYNPQMTGNTWIAETCAGKSEYYGSRGENKIPKKKGHYGKYPTNILEFPRHIRKASTRPDELVDYFIKTYTNLGNHILDITCYNALTGKRAILLGREYTGVDLNPQLED
tara:strand:+ start:971 stop:1639 length:669 start_codon:yes stop_codon:yes gene_type:complete